MRYLTEAFGILSIVSLFLACDPTTSDTKPSVASEAVVVGHELAKEAVLRSIPSASIDAARNNLHVAYQHTSHGTHVSRGLFGLPEYKTGDAALFAITNNSMSVDKLDFHDFDGNSGETLNNYGVTDLSNGVDALDANGDPPFVLETRAYLDNTANASINVVMWSWCSINGGLPTGHSVANYLAGMQTLINEYGPGGSKIVTGARAIPVSFIFMTGHAEAGANVGVGKPRDQAKLITDYCSAHGYWCLDYYSIDSHDMDGNYYDDAGDGDGTSNFYIEWQNSHTLGVDYFATRGSPGGSILAADHNPNQYITANRKAYAMWYILAGIAAERGFAE